MKIITNQFELDSILSKYADSVIGFVPTMGALHGGHISLIIESKKRTALTVCCIFVNPTQFTQQADFDKYPQKIEADILLLNEAACDILFLPTTEEIFPNGLLNLKNYDLGNLEYILEGEFRPGHFQGVCRVVDLLLQIVKPDILFLGEKDFQQCKVIQLMIETKQTNIQCSLITLPTIRGESGLAKSSRNLRLSPLALVKATALFKALKKISAKIKAGAISEISKNAKQEILNAGFEKVDYIAFANASSFQLLNEWDGKSSIVVLGAAYLDGIRLIDNIHIDVN